MKTLFKTKFSQFGSNFDQLVMSISVEKRLTKKQIEKWINDNQSLTGRDRLSGNGVEIIAFSHNEDDSDADIIVPTLNELSFHKLTTGI